MPYFNTIGLQNFRLFKDKTQFGLAPITILTGTNSSGKSSLIKALLLLRSSAKETGGIDKLSFSGGRHNLGWFGQTLNSVSEETEMTFTLNFPFEVFPKKTLIDLTYSGESKKSLSGNLKRLKVYLESGEVLFDMEAFVKEREPESGINFKGRIIKNQASGNSYNVKSDIPAFLKYMHSSFGKFWFTSEFKKYESAGYEKAASEFLEFVNNNYHFYEHSNADIFREFYFRVFDNSSLKEVKNKVENWEDSSPIDLVFENYSGEDLNDILNFIKKLKSEGVEIEGFHFQSDFLEDFNYAVEKIFSKLNIKFPTTYFLDESRQKEYDVKKEAWKKTGFGTYIFEEVFHKGIEKGIDDLKKSLIEIESLSSFRANTERIYSSNSEVVEINKLIWEFSQSEPERWKKVKDFLVASLKIFNIGDDIQIKSYQGVVSEIFVIKAGREVLLADLGYGFSQLIPIILKVGLIGINKIKEDFLSNRLRPTLFLLEEPEANLHPSLQSKLAEFILLAAKEFNIQFIVETHSEYMIRNFQYLTAKKDLDPWDTQIFYFNHPDSEDFLKTPVKEIDILSDGRLSKEFGEGFFDEIPRLLAFLYNSSFN